MPQGPSDMPTVMYGMGATKAGTSWLYDYLGAHPDCAMPIPKELHYFDRAEGFFKRDMTAKYQQRLDKLDPASSRAAALRRYIALVQADNGSNAAYAGYVKASAGQSALFGDITPSYSMVSTDMLRRMAQVAPVTKFVYLMRDPVARLWSNIRMEASMKADRMGGDAAVYAEEIAQNYIDGGSQAVASRSDYVGVLKRLTAAVPAKDVFVEFYERLFSADTITRLCAFLGIRDVAGDFGKRVHEGAKMTLAPDLRDALRAKLAPQYAGVAERFNDLPDAWQAKMGAA